MAAATIHDHLAESAQRIAAFIDGLPVALFRTTLEGEIVFCNAALAQAFGYPSARELIGSQVTRLYRNQKDRGRLIREILTHGCVRNHVVALKRQDNSPIWCAVTAQADLDDEDMVIHLDGVLWDIAGQPTAGENVSAGATNRRPACAEDDRFKGVLEMAGGVAHLMSQPLTIATNLLNELVADAGAAGGPLEKKIVKIQDQIEKINEITRKIANIHKYATMDYVAGVRIVDIDRAALV